MTWGHRFSAAVAAVALTSLVALSGPAAWAQDASGFSNGRRAVLYYDTATDATSRLVAYSNDFGADGGNVGDDFTVAFSASGIHTSAR